MALRFHPDLAGMGLQAGWRLEPYDFLADIGEFGKISVFPFPVMFWAVGEESLTIDPQVVGRVDFILDR